jgi:ribosomal protein S12 methylthiotransferase accessory factor
MDRLCIPNYSATLPGTEDSIWVYTGKGPTRAAGKASALMEAIERYSSLSTNYCRPFITGSYLQFSKSFNKVLHPAEVVEPVNQEYSEDSIIDFMQGFDILNNEVVLVPAQLALSRYSAKFPATNAFEYSHTNGLASGNVLEEAICHGLCEVIERDAVSIADLCASCIPYSILKRIRGSLKNAGNGGHSFADIPEDRFVDDPSLYRDVDISEVARDFDPIKSLVKRYDHAGISLLVKDITQKDIGLSTFVASSIEWISQDYGYFAKGYGTHPDSRIALMRAISESSQTRAVNIQGARDDLKKIQYKEDDEIYKRKWQFIPSSSLNKTNISSIKEFSEVKTYPNNDILDDIKLILNRLKKAGLKRAIVIDLTNPKLKIPVVRVIVPGLETFEVAKLFMASESFIGKRARRHFGQRLSPTK